MAMVTGASVVVPGELLAPVPKFCVPRPQFRCAMIVLEVGSEMSAPGVVCFWVSFVSGDNAAVPGEGLASEDARGRTGCVSSVGLRATAVRLFVVFVTLRKSLVLGMRVGESGRQDFRV